MSGRIPTRLARCVSTGILLAAIMAIAAPPGEASGLFSVGAGHTRFRDSMAVIWDPSWYLTCTFFFDVRPGLQLGLSMNYYFLQPRPASDFFGVGVMWEEPEGDGWMFSMMPAVRIPFSLGDDGSTHVYLQGGIGWYHLDMDVLYSGSVLVPEGEDIEKRITDKWDKPGVDGRFGVVTRLSGDFFLEISPGMSVIFTDDESTWSLNAYIAMSMKY
jgi:hypothetical protein